MAPRSWKDRVPLALALAAMLLALAGLTPAGIAATKAVDRVLFAGETSSVNGLRVSRTPRPNRLLPLGNDARFPASVVPRLPGMRGAPGDTGPAGTTGEAGQDGGRAVIVTRDDPVELNQAAQPQTVITIDNLEPGAFVLTGMVELSSPQLAPTRVRCAFLSGPDEIGSGIVTVGTAPGGATIATLPLVAATRHDLPATVRVDCTPQVPDHAIDIERAQVAALRVDSIQNLEVTQ